jgi:hypothetical protein
VVCVGHLRNFVRGKYGQKIFCHIFEDHTRNYFATQETHEFNISNKTGNKNPTVMGLGKLAPPVHHPLQVEFSRSKLPFSQFVNPHLYMGTSISYPIYRIYIPMFIDFVGLAFVGKDIVFRIIIEYSSLRDFCPYVVGLFFYEDF